MKNKEQRGGKKVEVSLLKSHFLDYLTNTYSIIFFYLTLFTIIF